MLIDGKDCEGGVSFTLVADIGGVTEVLVFRLKGLFFVDYYIYNFSKLAKTFEAAQSLFFGYIWGQPDHIESISLQNPH